MLAYILLTIIVSAIAAACHQTIEPI
ncbi:MAG: hypothetical protein ABUT20_48695 [Bacteroidota bacterium]